MKKSNYIFIALSFFGLAFLDGPAGADFNCSTQEMLKHYDGYNHWKNTGPNTGPSFDTRSRYCFANALVKNLQIAYQSDVPRLKPETEDWLVDEYYSGNYKRRHRVINDPDWNIYRYHRHVDRLIMALEKIQASQLAGDKNEEQRNWVWFVYWFSVDDLFDRTKDMEEQGFLDPTQTQFPQFGVRGLFQHIYVPFILKEMVLANML